MNIDKLKTKIREFAKKNNLTVQEAWDKYFFDSFLVRLSMSDYKDEPDFCSLNREKSTFERC